MNSSEIKTTDSYDWGTNVIYACSEIIQAGDNKVSVIRHHGKIAVHTQYFMSTVSHICEEQEVELVIYGYPELDIVYPHITTVEEESA